jgi:hypothetical protein
MKSKFTPQYVLEMLQEIKALSDQNRFNSARFSIKYPSFYFFRKILLEKSLLQKKLNKEKWIGIEPNFIMAKALSELKLKRDKEVRENQKLNKKDFSENIEQKEVLKAEKQQELEELEVPNKEENIEEEEIYSQMKIYSWQSVHELECKLQEVSNANASLIRQIGQIQNSKFFGRETITENETTDAKVEKLQEVLRIRDTELAKANEEIVRYENSFKSLQELSIEKINLINGKEKIIYEKGRIIESQKQEISELIKTISYQRKEIKRLKDIQNTNSSTLDQFEVVKNITNSTAIGILIQDIQTSSKLQTEEGEKLLLRLNKVLVDSYLGKERSIIIKHLFDFYAELSRQMNVPENLLSENLTHAENYFDKNFNQSESL